MFQRQLPAHGLVVELIIILLSHTSQGDVE